MLLYWVTVASHRHIYFVVPASSQEEAIKKATELCKGDWDRVPTLGVTDTRETHWCVGQRFRGMDGIYLCTSYDSRSGFWMENEADSSDKRNVSERAPERTYHRVYDEVA